MFDDFLRAAGRRGRRPVRAVRRRRRLRPSTSTASRAPTACAPSWLPRDRPPRGLAGRPPERDDRRARQPQERARAAADPTRGRRAVRRARCASCAPRATPGCAARSSRRAPTAASPEAAGSRTCSRSASTASSPSGSTSPASRPPTRSSPPREALGVEPAGGGVRGRAGRGRGRPSRRLRLRRRRRPVGQADALREHGARHRRRGPRRAARLDQHRAFRLDPWAVRETPSTSTCWRRPSRCSRSRTATSACAATSTRASRSASPART